MFDICKHSNVVVEAQVIIIRTICVQPLKGDAIYDVYASVLDDIGYSFRKSASFAATYTERPRCFYFLCCVPPLYGP